ncbi:unnamed protein product [Boreogadus saida]
MNHQNIFIPLVMSSCFWGGGGGVGGVVLKREGNIRNSVKQLLGIFLGASNGHIWQLTRQKENQSPLEDKALGCSGLAVEPTGDLLERRWGGGGICLDIKNNP